MTDKFTIAYVGLGIMGAPAAGHLLAAGHRLRIWARRPEAMEPLVERGATACTSAAEAADGADFAFTNVSDTPDVEEVVLGPAGYIQKLRPGSVVIDMSTIAPQAARDLAAALAAKEIAFVDAPVSGGQAGAEAGTLAFMCGGDEQAFARAAPLFEIMGSSHVLVGGSGAGQVAKCVNQILIGAAVDAVAEAFRLARRLDVDPAKIRQAIAGGFAGSKVLEVHAKRIIDDNYVPGFKARLHLKDIKIALAAAAECGVEVPSAEVFRTRLEQVIAAGHAEDDSSVAAKALAA